MIILFLQQRFITQTIHNIVGALKLGLIGWYTAVLRKKSHCSLTEVNLNGNVFVF